MILPSLLQLAHRLGGEVAGSQVLCPGPNHGPRDRSLSVLLSATAPFGFTAHSHAGDDFRLCRDYVAERLGIDRNGWKQARTQKSEPRPEPIKDNGRSLEIASRIIREIEPIAGTRGETYLRDARRIDTGATANVLERINAIGWHPACLFREEGHSLDGKRRGCIVAIITDAATGKPTGGISRTYIHEGLKVTKAKGLGPAGIVRLTADEDVLSGLFLTEGLETALDMMARDFRPIWSCGSTSIMAKFPVLSGIESISILADYDSNGAGERAARELEQRWLHAGREALILAPLAPGDFNDIAMRVAL
jgi:putative DNA primase/helicase